MRITLVLMAVWVVAAPARAAEALNGRVVTVLNGDSLVVATAGNKMARVRIADVDAPKGAQSYSNEAKRALERLALLKQVSLSPVSAPIAVFNGVHSPRQTPWLYARVDIDGLDVSTELVRSGAAWVLARYTEDDSLFVLEDQAAKARVGLWGAPNPVAPWIFRLRH